MLLKRLVEFVAMLLYLLLAGMLFMIFSSVCYVPEGCVGTPDARSVMLSAVFAVSLPVIFLILGRRHAIGAYAALTLVFVHFLLVGVVNYLGLPGADSAVGYLFCVTAAPFAPLIESVVDTFSAGRAIFYARILLPSAVYAFSMFAYLIAHNSANRRAIERNYAQMRMQDPEE